jgi:hypothetical protein
MTTPAAGRVGTAGQAHVGAHAAEMAYQYPKRDPFRRAFYACVLAMDLRYQPNGISAPTTPERNQTRSRRRAWIPREYYDDEDDCEGD